VSDLLTCLQLSSKQVVYKELKLKQYKTILKCLIAEPIDISNLFLNLNSILKALTNLTEEEILNLNFLEYFLLLTEIRITSIGNYIFAVSKIGNTSLNIEIPLNKTLEEIKRCINNFKPFKYENLNFVIPKIKDIIDSKDFLCIEEKNVIDLPVLHFKKINQAIKKFNNYFEQFYFFESTANKKYSLRLSISLDSYINLIKILYNENLLSIYDNIYYLSKICNFSSEYLENCTYGEFKIFVKKTEEILQKRVKRSNVKIQPLEEPSFDQINMDSFYGKDDTDLNISRSEFTP